MEKFKIPELHESPPKPASVQHNEVNGKLPFDQDQYHCVEYNNLLKNIIPLRQRYAESKDVSDRKAIATDEIGHWHEYMSVREKSLPEHYEINAHTISALEEVFKKESERRNNTLRSDRVVDYHYSFVKQKKKFDIPIHNHNLIFRTSNNQSTNNQLLLLLSLYLTVSLLRSVHKSYLNKESHKSILD